MASVEDSTQITIWLAEGVLMERLGDDVDTARRFIHVAAQAEGGSPLGVAKAILGVR